MGTFFARSAKKFLMLPVGYRIFVIVLTALGVIGVVIVTILSIIFTSNINATQRYCFITENNTLMGSMTTDYGNRAISWDFQFVSGLEPINNIQIMGPLSPGQTIPPFYFALCGSPSTLACDNTVPNQISQTIEQLSPSGDSLKPLITEMRQNPWVYFLNFNGIYSIGMYASNYSLVHNMYGKIAELIIYETNKIGVNHTIRTNINNFYSIY